MIRLKDLQNRVYSGKQCTQFAYEFSIDQDHSVVARFKRSSGETNIWVMGIVLDRTRDKDSEVYRFEYALPKDNVPLELIAAVGLRYFQLHIKEEVQLKSNMDFVLGGIIEGVVG